LLWLNVPTIACCCGHGKYPATIIVKDKQGKIFELISRLPLEMQKRNRYYKSDKEGYYFIPKVEQLRDTISHLETFYADIEEIVNNVEYPDQVALISNLLEKYKNEIMR